MGVYLFDHYIPWWVLVVGALIVTVVTVVLNVRSLKKRVSG